jgi:hypothetical protein
LPERLNWHIMAPSVASSIVPLSEVPREAFEAYLHATTSFYRDRTPGLIGWKYFDGAFNQGRGRGMVWVRRGEVAGFIGAIPAQMRRGDETRPLHWTCEWGLRDPKTSPGMGVKLLRALVGSVENVAGAGGNRNSTDLGPRMAERSLADAGLYLWRPLRASSLLQLAATRVPALHALGALAGSPLGRVPLPIWLGARRPSVRTFAGVAPVFDALFEQLRPLAWTAHYDQHYLDWAIARCPGIESMTCSAPGAASVAWYSTANAVRHARFAVWAVPDATAAARDVVAETVRAARRAGAGIVSTVVSRWDTELLAVLRRAGFLPRLEKLSLYLFMSAIDRLSGLNYFVADMAQRFRAA